MEKNRENKNLIEYLKEIKYLLVDAKTEYAQLLESEKLDFKQAMIGLAREDYKELADYLCNLIERSDT